MGKKAILFIVIGVVLGAVLAGAGVFFMIKNGGEKPVEEVVEEVVPEFDKAEGKRLTLEKVQIPLAATTSKSSYLQADFTIIFKTEEALTKAEAMVPDIKDAIYGVFETKTAEELKVKTILAEDGISEVSISPRETMKQPVLDAVRKLYIAEEDRENIVAVVISSFIVQ